MMRKTQERQKHGLRPLPKPWSGGLQTAGPSQNSNDSAVSKPPVGLVARHRTCVRRVGRAVPGEPLLSLLRGTRLSGTLRPTFPSPSSAKVRQAPGDRRSRTDDDFCGGPGLQNHDSLLNHACFVTMPLFPHPGAGEAAASLRDAIHCYLRFAPRSDAATDKTNPNDDRGQNLETSFFQWKMNIASWRGPGEKSCFYETNPNREFQHTWLQCVVKDTTLRRNKTKPNEQSETGKTLHERQLHPNPERRNQFTKPPGSPVRYDPIRPNPTSFDRMKSVEDCKCTMVAVSPGDSGWTRDSCRSFRGQRTPRQLSKGRPAMRRQSLTGAVRPIEYRRLLFV